VNTSVVVQRGLAAARSHGFTASVDGSVHSTVASGIDHRSTIADRAVHGRHHARVFHWTSIEGQACILTTRVGAAHLRLRVQRSQHSLKQSEDERYAREG
jgi:hypothetical protein